MFPALLSNETSRYSEVGENTKRLLRENTRAEATIILAAAGNFPTVLNLVPTGTIQDNICLESFGVPCSKLQTEGDPHRRDPTREEMRCGRRKGEGSSGLL